MQLSAPQKLAIEAYKAGVHEELLGYACDKVRHCQSDLTLLPTAFENLRKSHPQMFRDSDESKLTSFDRWNLRRNREAA